MDIFKDGMGIIHGDGLSGWVLTSDRFFSWKGELKRGTCAWWLVGFPVVEQRLGEGWLEGGMELVVKVLVVKGSQWGFQLVTIDMQ